MKQTRKARRREAAINSVKVLLTSVSLAATVGGWALISSADTQAAQVAQAPVVLVDAALVSTAVPTASTNLSVAAGQSASAAATAVPTTAATATTAPAVAPTTTALPTQVVVQTRIRTRSSR